MSRQRWKGHRLSSERDDATKERNRLSANSEYFPERSYKPETANVTETQRRRQNQDGKNQNPESEGHPPTPATSLRRYLLIILLSIVIGEMEGER